MIPVPLTAKCSEDIMSPFLETERKTEGIKGDRSQRQKIRQSDRTEKPKLNPMLYGAHNKT